MPSSGRARRCPLPLSGGRLGVSGERTVGRSFCAPHAPGGRNGALPARRHPGDRAEPRAPHRRDGSSTGMIEGITARLLEVGTYHLQCPLPPDTPAAAATSGGPPPARRRVIAAVPERQGTGLVSKSGAAGVSIRCVPPDVFSRDKGFSSYVTITAGSADLAGSRCCSARPSHPWVSHRGKRSTCSRPGART